jgi:hypothetical protein
MPVPGWVESLGLRAAWSAGAALVGLRGLTIQITEPRHLEVLSDPKPSPGGNSTSYLVRGKLKHLPRGHQIWLLVENEKTKKLWPQGWASVKYDPEKGEWMGRVIAKGDVRLIAVVAPPTSQQYFRYYQSLGDKAMHFEPLDSLPIECSIQTSVQTRIP